MTESLSRPEALKRIIRAGVEPVLLDAGFERAGKTSWMRHAQELDHMVGLLANYQQRHIQWGVVCREAVPLVWDKPPRVVDVAYGVGIGTPASISHPPACGSFHLDDQNDPEHIESLAAAVALDIGVVAEWMRPFRTRRELRAFLLQDRTRDDGHGFFYPASPAAKIYIAAVLAVLDRAPDAADLVAEAEQALQPWIKNKLAQGQVSRLRAALSSAQG